MPQAWPAISAFVKWMMTAKTLTAFVVRLAVATAVAAGLGRLLARRGNNGLTSASPLDLRIDPMTPHRVIYGERGVGGVLRFRHATGSSNAYLYLVLVWAAHECQAITAFKVDGATVSFDGTGNAIGTFAGVMRVTHHLGAHDQAADANFVAELSASGKWTAAHRLQGRCYSAIRLKWDPDKFPGGVPQFMAVVQGKKCYDWRDASQSLSDYATWQWSDNPMVCSADFLRGCPMLDGAGNLIRPYGIGCDEDQIPADRWIAEANACDEVVPLADGGSEKRYTCNGCFDTDTAPPLVLDALAASAAGKIVPTGAAFLPFAGVWHAPDFTVTEAMLRDEPAASNPLPRPERLNTVKGTYLNPDANYQPDDFTPVVLTGFLDEDGGELARDIDMAFTTSPTMARRIAKIAALRTRQGLVTQWPCNLRALPALGGENVSLTSSEFGWASKAFEVSEFVLSIQKGDDGGMGFAVDLQMQETDPSIYDWNTSEEDVLDPAPNTDSPDMRSVAVPTVTLNIAGSADRTALPRVRVSLNAPTDPWVIMGGVSQIAYKKRTDADWVTWSTLPSTDQIDFISDLQIGGLYDVRARRRNRFGVWSLWSATASIVAPSGLGNYVGDLSNDLHGVACNGEGVPLAGELGAGGRAVTTVSAWAGSVPLTATNSTPGDGQFSISAAVLAGTATVTKVGTDAMRVDTLGSASALVRITINAEGVVSIPLDFTIVKVNSGGAYWLVSDAAAVNQAQSGALTPATLNFAGWAKLLTAPEAYAGRFVISTYSAGAWTDVYTSAANETAKAFAVPAGVKAIRCRLYQAGGVTTLFDEEIIPVTMDGAQGAPGTPGSDGDDGASMEVEYSVNGVDSWHFPFAAGDKYMRQRVGGGDWSAAIKIVGDDGAPGSGGSTPQAAAPSVGFAERSSNPSNADCTIYTNESGGITWYAVGGGALQRYTGPFIVGAWLEVAAYTDKSGKLSSDTVIAFYEYGIPP